jgi:hypothetical protein
MAVEYAKNVLLTVHKAVFNPRKPGVFGRIPYSILSQYLRFSFFLAAFPFIGCFAGTTVFISR